MEKQRNQPGNKMQISLPIMFSIAFHGGESGTIKKTRQKENLPVQAVVLEKSPGYSLDSKSDKQASTRVYKTRHRR